MHGFQDSPLELAMPSHTRIEIEEQDSKRSLVHGHFPTGVLMRYSGYARRELPHSRRHDRVAVLTLPCTASEAKPLRYILNFLKILPTHVYSSPYIRCPGMFHFSEAALLYRMALLLELPWDLHISLNQLLGYMSETQLTFQEFSLVWEKYPRDSIVVTSMLKAFVRFLRAKRYEKEELHQIKRYCKEMPERLRAIDRTVKELELELKADGRKMHGSRKDIHQRKIDVARGVQHIDQVFVRSLKRQTRRASSNVNGEGTV